MNLKLLALVALAFVAGAGVFSVMNMSFDETSIDLLIVQDECDLNHSSCLAQDKLGHEVSFSLSPRPVPLLKDVMIDVTVKRMETLRAAQINIEGLNMYMGIQTVPLTLNSIENASEQKLTGILQLPVCTSRKMEWSVTLIMQTATNEYRVVYPFTTLTP